MRFILDQINSPKSANATGLFESPPYKVGSKYVKNSISIESSVFVNNGPAISLILSIEDNIIFSLLDRYLYPIN